MSVLDGKKLLIAQPAPQNGSPYHELESKYKLKIDFNPFFKVVPVLLNEFREQRVSFNDYTAIVFSSRTAIDAFFHIAEQTRTVIPDTMKYFCQSEAIALYLQKYIIYRKRKIFFGTGTFASLLSIITGKHKNEKLLIVCTDALKPETEKAFKDAKLNFGSVVLVKTENCDLSGLDLDKYGMIVFYSPSDVKSLMDNFPSFNKENILFATYGASTAKAAKNVNLAVEIEAPTPECPSIAGALSHYFAKN